MVKKIEYTIKSIPKNGVTVCDNNGAPLTAGTQTGLDKIYIVVDESKFLQED